MLCSKPLDAIIELIGFVSIFISNRVKAVQTPAWGEHLPLDNAFYFRSL